MSSIILCGLIGMSAGMIIANSITDFTIHIKGRGFVVVGLCLGLSIALVSNISK